MYAQNAIQEKIIAPAVKDEAFRQRLLSSPKLVLERELGITLPQDVNVQVHEETPATLHFVLPKSPYAAVAAAWDRELEQAGVDGPPKHGIMSFYTDCQTDLTGPYCTVYTCGCTNFDGCY
jgi:hypothetical protein